MTPLPLAPIHGSYLPEDCAFLLTPIQGDFVSIAEKEALIQSGQRHYSEMIHRESAPSPAYLALYEVLCQRYAPRMAREIRALARLIVHEYRGSTAPAETDTGRVSLTLVSLVRAGTPLGVLLKRAIEGYENADVAHYSVSIIRDRGIDTAALDYILAQPGVSPDTLLFVDAWTAKGTITRELHHWVEAYNATRRAQRLATIAARLAVLSDIGGTADFAATLDDYAIPSGVLNATVSGLVSRSVLNDQVPDGAFHGCVAYDELAPFDQTRRFIERVAAHFDDVHFDGVRFDESGEVTLPVRDDARRARQGERMRDMLACIQAHYRITDINLIKPGIAEATRVMLRRVPELLLLKDPGHPDVEHLVLLAREKGVEIIIWPTLPFHACSLIRVVNPGQEVA